MEEPISWNRFLVSLIKSLKIPSQATKCLSSLGPPAAANYPAGDLVRYNNSPLQIKIAVWLVFLFEARQTAIIICSGLVDLTGNFAANSNYF
jgi:hypothetical protein